MIRRHTTSAAERTASIATERGGILDRAADVAHEIGKPAVVGVAGAMRRFRSGEKVWIDGNSGEVRVEK